MSQEHLPFEAQLSWPAPISVGAIGADALGRVLAAIPMIPHRTGRYEARPAFYLYRYRPERRERMGIWNWGDAEISIPARYVMVGPREVASHFLHLRRSSLEGDRTRAASWHGRWVLDPSGRLRDFMAAGGRHLLPGHEHRRIGITRPGNQPATALAPSIHALVLFFHWGPWLAGAQPDPEQARRMHAAGLPVTALRLARIAVPGSDDWTVWLDRFEEFGHPHTEAIRRATQDPVLLRALRWWRAWRLSRRENGADLDPWNMSRVDERHGA